MAKLHDLITDLQDYEKTFGNIPVYISSQATSGKDINILPCRSSNVTMVSNADEVGETNKTEIHIVILADYSMAKEGGEPMETSKEDKNE